MRVAEDLEDGCVLEMCHFLVSPLLSREFGLAASLRGEPEPMWADSER